jgi:hypothetical protein
LTLHTRFSTLRNIIRCYFRRSEQLGVIQRCSFLSSAYWKSDPTVSKAILKALHQGTSAISTPPPSHAAPTNFSPRIDNDLLPLFNTTHKITYPLFSSFSSATSIAIYATPRHHFSIFSKPGHLPHLPDVQKVPSPTSKLTQPSSAHTRHPRKRLAVYSLPA